MPRNLQPKQRKRPEAAVSAAGMRIIRLLVGCPPKSIAELIDATEVTRTAVTEQLSELVAAGFVERTIQRLPGRGRPRHLYSATDAALLLLFASNQRLLVPAIWEAIADIGGRELRRKVLKRVSRMLANHYKQHVSGKTPKQRLLQLSQLLREEGGLVDVEENGQLLLRKRSCEFISMFEDTRTVCSIDHEMMTLVVGTSVRQVASRHDGHPCCTFAIDSSNGKK